MQTARNYFLRGPSYTALKSPLAVMQNFQLLHICYCNRGWSGVNLNNTVRLSDLENMEIRKNSAQFFTMAELYRFEFPLGCNAYFQKLKHKNGQILKFLNENI